jgi:histidinol phosphatase-like PHP family hydrolase
MPKALTIALLTDVHYSPGRENETNRVGIADIFLERAVERVNRFVRPDITLVLGDLVDDGTADDAGECLRRLREIIDKVRSPVIVIPGNHDPEPEAFYRVFERPAEVLDVAGVRFVPFLDEPAPEYNAVRSEADLQRMRRIGAGADGPLIAVQHVPVFPPGTGECPYNYLNAEDVLAAMREGGYFAALAGHWHDGMDPLENELPAFAAGPTLCRPPFQFMTIEFDGERFTAARHCLQMPPELRLVDRHVHSQFAYCAQDVEIVRALELGREFGLAGIAFAEHSGQLYFSGRAYGRGDWFEVGLEAADGSDDRFGAYVSAALSAGCPRSAVGLEVDCDARGRLVLREEDRAKAGFLMASVHQLAALRGGRKDAGEAGREFLEILERLCAAGIAALGHPFRVFNRRGVETPSEVFAPVAELLRRHGVAAELNFSQNDPPEEFFRLCIESGVRLSLGSDAHALRDVGELTPHLAFLRRLGCMGSLQEVLVGSDRPATKGRPATQT